MRRHRSRVSNFAAGLVAAVVILVVCFLVFGGSIPFIATFQEMFPDARQHKVARDEMHAAMPAIANAVDVRERARGAVHRSERTACPAVKPAFPAVGKEAS